MVVTPHFVAHNLTARSASEDAKCAETRSREARYAFSQIFLSVSLASLSWKGSLTSEIRKGSCLKASAKLEEVKSFLSRSAASNNHLLPVSL